MGKSLNFFPGVELSRLGKSFKKGVLKAYENAFPKNDANKEIYDSAMEVYSFSRIQYQNINNKNKYLIRIVMEELRFMEQNIEKNLSVGLKLEIRMHQNGFVSVKENQKNQK